MLGPEQIATARARIVETIGETIGGVPAIALVLGSGLGAFADGLDDRIVLDYGDIPGFPNSTVVGHAGRMIAGRLDGRPLLVLQGRAHYYEGYAPEQVVFPVRVLAALGVKQLVLTNAAGAVNTALAPGELMMITDHINMTGQNPLIGPNDDSLGPRFPDMTAAYDPGLRRILTASARAAGVKLHAGVYLGCTGPSYETPAEIRMYRMFGADACGMSTVLETIAAVHAGLRVAAISCITNMGAGIAPGPLHHDEVMPSAALVKDGFDRLLRHALPRFAEA